MRAIYFDGRVDGAGAAAVLAAAALPVEGGPIRLRDASAWLQRPDGTERFSSVVIPTGEEFDSLAAAYADAGAEVARSGAVEPPPPPPPPATDPEPPAAEPDPEPDAQPTEPATAPAPVSRVRRSAA